MNQAIRTIGLAGVGIGIALAPHVQAQNNPILKQEDPGFVYAADPAAEVFNGKVYVYCSRDQPDAKGYSGMQDYVVLESPDMKTWINHGVVLKPREYSWADGQMNAPDCAYKDGWYYLYFPYDKTYVGVAKSRSPAGPWEEAVTDKITTIFDPTVFVDDDGQAYIYGTDSKVNVGPEGKEIWGAKLKDNMVELDGPWYRLSGLKDKISEGVTIFKRDGIYYFMARVGNKTGYWMADNPLPSPDNPDNPKQATHNTKDGYANFIGFMSRAQNDAPCHMSAIEFNNQWYYFYHRGVSVNNGSYNKRSASFDKLEFNEDGTIQTVQFTLETVDTSDHGKGSVHLDAADFSESHKVLAATNLDKDGGLQLQELFDGSWAKYEHVDFGENPDNQPIPFFVRAYSDRRANEQAIEIRLDSLDSEPIAIIPITDTKKEYQTFSTMLENVKGKHTLYVTFKGEVPRKARLCLMTINWFEYTPAN
ncbi:Arabinoxylan arabinofuranohydrolase [Pontiella desulfatans]|uniref:Arabinoxylan arabinofuranohydrolase n=2 Tax=Pontiella desulfatans TaxID=2750659 RepID=A0A6C2TZP2_PONDE|nr:Arabinoxylan arabinofuranohydrolase [Pontiella desulfatans]